MLKLSLSICPDISVYICKIVGYNNLTQVFVVGGIKDLYCCFPTMSFLLWKRENLYMMENVIIMIVTCHEFYE